MSRDRSHPRYRFYGVYQLPREYGGGELPVRVYENVADRTRGFYRAEHVRAIPPTDMDFPRLNSRRNDAESINRALEDTLYWGRATAPVTSRRRPTCSASASA
jgi:hypothetical protein